VFNRQDCGVMNMTKRDLQSVVALVVGMLLVLIANS
jgi:hypothetical protein